MADVRTWILPLPPLRRGKIEMGVCWQLTELDLVSCHGRSIDGSASAATMREYWISLGRGMLCIPLP